MEEMMYLAAQYLAAANLSFLKKEEDDSHSNLGFALENCTLSSRPLNNQGVYLALNYKKFSLEWHTKSTSITFPLNGSTHKEILQWVQQMVAENKLGTYHYKFHYDAPYKITDDFTFKLLDRDSLQKLTAFRILAQTSLRHLLQKEKLTSEIRIWPHHFDTGIYASLQDGDGVAIGAGLAVPDGLVADHYFYISGYKDGKALEVSGFEQIKIGGWINKEFKGAVLPSTDGDQTTVNTFFKTALNAYRNL